MKELDLLGRKVTEKVTGMEGIITSISYDLYGCIQALFTPSSKDNTYPDAIWFDITRLEIQDGKPVMKNPFTSSVIGIKGPERKPVQ